MKDIEQVKPLKITAMIDKDQIIKAWDLLNNLEASIKYNCTIEQDEITDIRCLYYKCKNFIKAVDNDPKF